MHFQLAHFWFAKKSAKSAQIGHFLKKLQNFKIRGPETEFSDLAYVIVLVVKKCLFDVVVPSPILICKVEIFEIFEILLDFCWKFLGQKFC